MALKTIQLFVVACGVLVAYLMTLTQGEIERTDYYDQQREAVIRMAAMMDAIKAERLERGLAIDSEIDPLETGLIGFPWPDFGEPSITTTSGFLPAKQLSVNPNFAALMVRYFHDLNLQANDTVHVYFSSSFPALNLAILAAIETMDLHAVVASSIGASSYGANAPTFTWIDMEHHLLSLELLSTSSQWVSLGGENDRLEEETDETFKETLRTHIHTLGYTFIDETDFAQNVETRYRSFRMQGGRAQAFINVGGALVATGRHGRSYPSGVTHRYSVRVGAQSGLIDYYFRDDIPVIHLLNISNLARRYAMQTDVRAPFIHGVGSMYVNTTYPIIYTVMAFIWTGSVLGSETVLRYIRKPIQKRGETS